MSFCSRSRLHIKLGCGCPDMSLYILPKTWKTAYYTHHDGNVCCLSTTWKNLLSTMISSTKLCGVWFFKHAWISIWFHHYENFTLWLLGIEGRHQVLYASYFAMLAQNFYETRETNIAHWEGKAVALDFEYGFIFRID